MWLSTNSLTTNTSRIAYINGWTNSREWNKYGSQTSTARTLTAGQSYYFSVLHKEGNGGDYLAVGWTGPGISTISVIGGSNIAPYTGGAREASDVQLSDNSVTIYPNPATQEVIISGLANSSVIDLLNLDGKIVISQTSTTASENVSLSNIPAGLYILKVKDAAQVTKVFKLSIY